MLPLFAAFNLHYVEPRAACENSPLLRVVWRVSPRSRSQNSGLPHSHSYDQDRTSHAQAALSLIARSIPGSTTRHRTDGRTNVYFPSIAFPFRSFKKLASVVHHAHRRHHPSALLRHFVFGVRRGGKRNEKEKDRARLDFRPHARSLARVSGCSCFRSREGEEAHMSRKSRRAKHCLITFIARLTQNNVSRWFKF